jgi:hypothetical protein
VGFAVGVAVGEWVPEIIHMHITCRVLEQPVVPAARNVPLVDVSSPHAPRNGKLSAAKLLQLSDEVAPAPVQPVHISPDTIEAKERDWLNAVGVFDIICENDGLSVPPDGDFTGEDVASNA